MKGLERKRQILTQIIVGREAEMAETSKGKHNDNCLKNYLSGGRYLKPGSPIWICIKKFKYDSIGAMEGILLSTKKEA